MVSPLALALHPLMPVRTPREGRATVLYGYQLRLAGGPRLTHDDALLLAFAASAEALEGDGADSEPLQADSFDPGLPVRLVREGVDDDGDEIIGVWDGDETRRAGTLPYHAAARIAAAIDHGMAIEALVLSEIRSRFDDRRSGIAVFTYAPALIDVDVATGGPLQRPQTRARPRLVLIGDEGDGLRWWDPSGATGPMELDAVPVSATLATELRQLAGALKNAPSQTETWDDADLFEDMQEGYRRHVLDERAKSVWVRVRRELGRRYVVGLMLRGMQQPVWSPEEWQNDDGEDDDIPF